MISSIISKGITSITEKESLVKKLESGKRLRIKFGIDPTGSKIHLGHMVPLLKLREFQKLGHTAVIIIGDATAQIGDTSDKDSERPMLTREETRKNCEDWISRISKLLDPTLLEIRFNSEWMDGIGFEGVGTLAKVFSVNEMLSRDNFRKRFDEGKRISLQEFLYPLMQGLDSAEVEADVELGGNDQLFNLLAGRKIQESFGQAKQDIMTLGLLVGSDGKKMSKTSQNRIGIDDAPNEMFSKIMLVSDSEIRNWFELASPLSPDEINEAFNSAKNTLELKTILAKSIVAFYHSEKDSVTAENFFNSFVIGKGDVSTSDELKEVFATDIGMSKTDTLVSILKALGFHGTSGDARNAILSGGVSVDGIKCENPSFKFDDNVASAIIRSGKRNMVKLFFR